MKKEINQTDIDKIFTLKRMTEDIVNLLKAEEKYINYLFQYFQNDRYYETNFFTEKTVENNLYNYLDKLDRDFKQNQKPFLRMLGSLDYFLFEFEYQKKNKGKTKKEQKNNVNN